MTTPPGCQYRRVFEVAARDAGSSRVCTPPSAAPLFLVLLRGPTPADGSRGGGGRPRSTPRHETCLNKRSARKRPPPPRHSRGKGFRRALEGAGAGARAGLPAGLGPACGLFPPRPRLGAPASPLRPRPSLMTRDSAFRAVKTAGRSVDTPAPKRVRGGRGQRSEFDLRSGERGGSSWCPREDDFHR